MGPRSVVASNGALDAIDLADFAPRAVTVLDQEVIGIFECPSCATKALTLP
jgi:hypothetical protein